MRRFIATGILGVALGLWTGHAPVGGQTVPKPVQEGGSEDAIKQRQNQWTVGLAGGTMDGTYLRLADELGRVLDDGDEMRVLPIISRGAASNLQDLLYLRGVDVAFTQLDVLEHFRTQRRISNLESRVQYIVRLPIAELHVTARSDIQTVEDLRGQKVVFGAPGTAPALTGPMVFQRLGIDIEPVYVDPLTGLKKLMNGEVAALVDSASKPVDFWLKLPPNTGLHLLPVPFTKALADIYAIGEFTHADYPNLIPLGQRIDTIAVPSVLITNNWPKDSDRYRRVERFVQYLFNRWDRLTQLPFHPRWRDVNLAATVPGWTRFATSEEMLRLAQNSPDPPPSVQDFQTYLSRVARFAPRNQAERDAMFRQFLIWREQQQKQ